MLERPSKCSHVKQSKANPRSFGLQLVRLMPGPVRLSAQFPIWDSLLACTQGSEHFCLRVALLALLAQGKALRKAVLPTFR